MHTTNKWILLGKWLIRVDAVETDLPQTPADRSSLRRSGRQRNPRIRPHMAWLVHRRRLGLAAAHLPMRIPLRMGRKAASLSISSKKFAAFSIRSKAQSAVTESGTNASRCSKSYFRSSQLKRAVGGPKRSEGLPYRGPVGPSTGSALDGSEVPDAFRLRTGRYHRYK